MSSCCWKFWKKKKEQCIRLYVDVKLSSILGHTIFRYQMAVLFLFFLGTFCAQVEFCVQCNTGTVPIEIVVLFQMQFKSLPSWYSVCQNEASYLSYQYNSQRPVSIPVTAVMFSPYVIIPVELISLKNADKTILSWFKVNVPFSH